MQADPKGLVSPAAAPLHEDCEFVKAQTTAAPLHEDCEFVKA